jgi:hypothetical protein
MLTPQLQIISSFTTRRRMPAQNMTKLLGNSARYAGITFVLQRFGSLILIVGNSGFTHPSTFISTNYFLCYTRFLYMHISTWLRKDSLTKVSDLASFSGLPNLSVARKFMDKYRKDHETFHASEMQRLSGKLLRVPGSASSDLLIHPSLSRNDSSTATRKRVGKGFPSASVQRSSLSVLVRADGQLLA